MRVIRKTTAALSIAVGADEVLGWAPLPTGASLVSVTGELHIVGFENRAIAQFAAFGMSGYVIPVVDPTNAITIKETWDTMVIKSQDPTLTAASNTLDYEWDVADTTPTVTPGEMRAETMMGLGDEKQKEFFPPRIEWLSFAKGPQAGFVAGTPDAWSPTALRRFRSRRRLTATEPSYAMIAVTNPLLADVVSVENTLDTPAKWAMLANLRNILGDFWRMQTGLTEAGAESPYADVTTAIRELTAPDMLDETSTLFDDTNPITALMDCTWELEMPDNTIPRTLDGR